MATIVAMATVSISLMRARKSGNPAGLQLPRLPPRQRPSIAFHSLLKASRDATKLSMSLVGDKQLVVRQALAARHRRGVLADRAVVQELVGLLVVLAAQRHVPVDEQPRGLPVRALVRHAAEERGRRQAVGGRHELDRGTSLLDQQIAGIFGQHAKLVVALGKTLELLGARVEPARTDLRELAPELVAVELAQFVPLHELHAGVGHLHIGAVVPDRLGDVLPALGRILRLHLLGVVGEARERDADPEIVADRIAQVVGRIELGLRRDIARIAAALLEIERGGRLGELDDVGRELSGRALGDRAAEQRAVLRPHIFALDLGEVLVERRQDAGDPRLAVVAVVGELAFGLGLGDVGGGGEIEDFRDRPSLRRQPLRQQPGRKRHGGDRKAAFHEGATRRCALCHGVSPL